MGGGGSSPYDEFGYIKDGKVFHLDGINKGATDGTWVDLIGGKIFQNFGADGEVDCFHLTNNAYFESEGQLYNSNYTVECCFSPDTDFTGMVFQSGPSQASATLYLYLNQGLFLDQGLCYNLTKKVGTNTVSLNNSIGYQNFNKLVRSNVRDFWTGIDVFSIGRNPRPRFYYAGRIYAIRLYDRLLSEEEMLNNQQVDNTRFNLGLTI